MKVICGLMLKQTVWFKSVIKATFTASSCTFTLYGHLLTCASEAQMLIEPHRYLEIHDRRVGGGGFVFSTQFERQALWGSNTGQCG